MVLEKDEPINLATSAFKFLIKDLVMNHSCKKDCNEVPILQEQ